jgi:hypothetical protein
MKNRDEEGIKSLKDEIKEELIKAIESAGGQITAVTIRKTEIGTVYKFFIVQPDKTPYFLDESFEALEVFPKNRKADGTYTYDHLRISGLIKMKLGIDVKINFYN